MKLILVSKSPRRQQLLREMGYDFEVRTYDVEENFPETMRLEKVAEFLAEKKALAAMDDLQLGEVVLASDTTVILDSEILNKPADADEARKMLRSLSGRSHKVVTGVCVADKQQRMTLSETTEVTFRELKDEEIEHYIKTASPFDKAGAYGIQEWIGMVAITSIKGSYFNVVGLPTTRVYDLLKEWED